MFKEYKGKNFKKCMEESALRFNEVKTTVLNEIEKLENDKALGNRVFQMHSAPKEKTNAPVAAVKKSGKKLISEYPPQKNPTERLHDDIREWTSKETS